MDSKPRVLVVDDEPDFLRMIGARLESLGYRVEMAQGGKAALAAIRREKPQAVLLDIVMPQMDGLRVLSSIRRRHKRLPVFMLTAYTSEETFGKARKLGASGFIPKNADLARALRSALRVAPGYRKGFTLIEVMIAVVLLAGGIAAATFIFSRGMFATTDAEGMEQGMALAQEKMESVRATSFGSIASESKAAVSGWTGFSRQVEVTQPSGTNSNLKQVVVTVYLGTVDGELSTSLTTHVANVTNS